MSDDPGFDAFVDAVERACHRYRHAEAQRVDPTLAKAQLIAVCDVMAHQPACKPEPDPMPDGLVDRTLAEIRDHIDFTIERDHLEDVPDGMFRETCLRCGFHRYQPESELEDALARIDAQGAPNLFAVDDAEGEDPTPIRPDDAPEVWVYGDGDEPQDDER